MSEVIIILIILSVYIIGAIITTLICYKLDVDDDDVVAFAWLWPFCLCLIIIFGALLLPVGIYKILDGKPDKNDKNDYYDSDYDWEDYNE